MYICKGLRFGISTQVNSVIILIILIGFILANKANTIGCFIYIIRLQSRTGFLALGVYR